jgi:DNA-3-methyladenine glycosylase
MHIDKSHNQHDLQSKSLYIAANDEATNFTIIEKPRVGIPYAKEWTEKPLRFYIKDNPFISKS